VITIEAIATVTPEGKVTIQLPATILPGNHKLVLVIDEQPVISEKHLQHQETPRHPRRSLRGVCAEPKLDLTEAAIAEARREMWATFPRENL